MRVLDEFRSTLAAVNLFFETADVFNYHMDNTSARKRINLVLERTLFQQLLGAGSKSPVIFPGAGES